MGLYAFFPPAYNLQYILARDLSFLLPHSCQLCVSVISRSSAAPLCFLSASLSAATEKRGKTSNPEKKLTKCCQNKLTQRLVLRVNLSRAV